MKTNAIALKLTATQAYRVHYWDGDRSGHDVTIGYFSSSTKADAKAKGAGWYGGDADVDYENDIFTDGEFIYKVEKLGRYTDQEEERKEILTASIKNKLTVEELDFLKQYDI